MQIKKWFLPHKTNNHHPIAIRPLGLSILLATILIINSSYNFVVARRVQILGYATSISASEVIALSNQQRANNGMGSLSYNGQLAQAAQAKAQDMIAKNYWSHYSPEGNGPGYFISQAGYSYSIAGENLAKDFNTSSGVVNAWMGSTSHRANILNAGFVHTGVAVVNGVLQGKETTLVVAMYGAPPASAPAPTPAPAPPAAPTPTTTPNPAPALAQSSTAASPQETVADQESSPGPITVPETQGPVYEAAQEETAESAGTGTTLAPPSEGGEVKSAMEQSVVTREQLNWAQQSSLLLLSTVMFITILKHTLVWRTDKRGWRHIWFRAHPAVQYALILVAFVTTFASSVGVIR